MTIIDRFFNLFQRKAVKDSSVIVMPAKTADEKPEVKYVERIINANNVDAYRSGRAQFVGGDHVNIPADLKEKLRHLCHEYEDATSQTLHSIMERFTRGQK